MQKTKNIAIRLNWQFACILTLCVFIICTSAYAGETQFADVVRSGNNGDAEDGWYEIKSTHQKTHVANIQPTDNGDSAGDRMYFVEPGDRPVDIAEKLTGSSNNWKAISAYNRLSDSDNLDEGMLLVIPQSLLKKRAAVLDTSEIRELKAAAAYLRMPEQIPAEPARVVSRNIDLFVGQVSVLDKVSVTRVAVGSGAVIRAEVLASGELLVIAQSVGSTSVRLWHRDGTQSDYNIRVSEHDPETRFHMEKMVRLRVKMVEFRKSALGRLGIDWGDTINGPTFATAGDLMSNALFRPTVEGFAESLPNAVQPFSSYFGIATSLSSRINFLSSTGDAVMLAEPTLSCANGGNAHFLAGGEVPYPTIGANGQTTVEFKEYGIKLDISPRIDTAGNVQTSVLTEISSIDPAVSVQGAPGLLTRRTQTQVNVRTGQTIVIAGLLQSDASNDLDRVPGIGKLPILGALFRSKNIRNNISELVIFITPEVVDPTQKLLSKHDHNINTESSSRLESIRDHLQIKLLE